MYLGIYYEVSRYILSVYIDTIYIVVPTNFTINKGVIGILL